MIYPIAAELLHPWTDRGMDHYSMVSDDANPRKMYRYWGSDEHLAGLKRFKKWADKGYWSRSILSSSEDPVAAFQAGKLAAKISGINPVKYSQDVIVMGNTHPEWEVGYFPFSLATGVVHPVHPTHNGYAVPISSRHPERAVAFFEKMVLDKRYNRLTNYGIEGVHYEEEDGYYKLIGDASTSGFKRENMNCWAWRNPELMLFDKNCDRGFVEDSSEYQRRRTG